MSKMFRFDDHARLALKKGVDQLADAVRVTLGPRGRSVVLEKRDGAPVITNDGITIVRDIELADPYENLGAQLLREVANKTAELAGDGTTTATILAQSIVSQGLLAVTAGENPAQVKRGIDRAVDVVIAELRKFAKPVEGLKAMARVAKVSSRLDQAIGDLVAEALHRVGADGVVTVEESKGTETKLRFVDGMRFDRGYLSPYFVNDPEHMEVEYRDAYLLLSDQKVSAVREVAPILEEIARMGAPVVIVAEEIEGEALATLVMNRLRGALECVAVKAPGFGERRRDMLEDMAALTGATVISEEQGLTLERATVQHLGRVRHARVSRDHTTLVGGAGDRKVRDARVELLRRQVAATQSAYDREKLKERLAKLSGGVAEIEVGGRTEIELKERKDRVEDALAATRAAVEEGVVPGGGVAFLRAVVALDGLRTRPGGERAGVEIVRRALESPARTIAENAGFESGAVLSRILKGEGGFGFNAESGEFEDLDKAGILDPAKVTRLALLHAASIGSLILTTETLVAEKPDEPEPPATS